jgi:hypothetical protein
MRICGRATATALTVVLSACGAREEGSPAAGPSTRLTIEPATPLAGVPGLLARVETPFRVMGERFGQASGLDVVVRFRASAGRPFLGGTAVQDEVPGRIVVEGLVEGIAPRATLVDVASVDAFVTVVLPGGFEIASAQPIARFLAPWIEILSPEGIDAVADPWPVRVTGRYFGPSAAAEPVLLEWQADAPILAGGDEAATRVGLLLPDGTIEGDSPDAVLVGTSDAVLSLVRVRFSDGTTSRPGPLRATAHRPRLDPETVAFPAGRITAMRLMGSHLGPIGTPARLAWTSEEEVFRHDSAWKQLAETDGVAGRIVGGTTVIHTLDCPSPRTFVPDRVPTASALEGPLGTVPLLVRAVWPDGSATQAAVAPCTSRLAEWMANLPDDIAIARMSIPGTHDTMAYQADAQLTHEMRTFTLTQSIDLDTQLRHGARVIDIRCRRIGGTFTMHHGSVYLGTNFTDVLTTVRSFLQSHPTETVLMSIQEEHEPDGSEPSFVAIFDTYVDSFPDLFWALDVGDRLPTLGEARGRVVVIWNEGEPRRGFPSSGSAVQPTVDRSEYQLRALFPSRWWKRDAPFFPVEYGAPDAKRSEVSQLLDEVAALPDEGGPLYFVALNATSLGSSLGEIIDDLAAEVYDGRWDPKDTSEEVNPFVRSEFGTFLEIPGLPPAFLTGRRAAQRRTGIVTMDFFSSELAREVLRCNYRLVR